MNRFLPRREGTYTMSDTTPNPRNDPVNRFYPGGDDPSFPFSRRRADEQMNQYTTVPRGAPAGSVTMELEHDLNGNLKLIPFQADDETTPLLATATYDYRNLMVKYERGDLTADYKYDALGRRTEKTLDDGEATTTTLYLHRGYQEIEERDAEEEVLATYAHGNGIDEVLNMRRDGEDFFYHADDQGTVWAITDSEGAVVERYNYEDYGETYVLDPSGGLRPESLIGNPSRYTGRRFDRESTLYWYRTRYYDPVGGRFTSRDSIGVWEDLLNMGAGLAYVGCNPYSLTDPHGQLVVFELVVGVVIVGVLVILALEAHSKITASLARKNLDCGSDAYNALDKFVKQRKNGEECKAKDECEAWLQRALNSSGYNFTQLLTLYQLGGGPVIVEADSAKAGAQGRSCEYLAVARERCKDAGFTF